MINHRCSFCGYQMNVASIISHGTPYQCHACGKFTRIANPEPARPAPVDDGVPAFPITAGNQVYAKGMTKREWYAGMALQGILAGYWGNSDMSGLGPDEHARAAVDAADAMIKALK